MTHFEKTVQSLVSLLNRSLPAGESVACYLEILSKHFESSSLVLRNNEQFYRYPDAGLEKLVDLTAFMEKNPVMVIDARATLELYLELPSLGDFPKNELAMLKELSLTFFREFSLKKKLAHEKKIVEELKRENEEIARLKSQFIATISHEIRTPMNGIIGATDLLLNTGDLSPMAKQFTEIIQTSSTGLMTLVNEVLDFAKLESGQMSIVSTKQNLRQILTEVCYEYKSKMLAKGLYLYLDLDGLTTDTVYTDIVRLKQVLVNLIENAIKFTDKGSITVKIKTVDVNEDYVKTSVTVTDTGIGIAEEEIDSVFESFSQGDSSFTRRFGGTGLGLSICYKIVALLGGEIEVESELGQGSSFTFSFNAALASSGTVKAVGLDKLQSFDLKIVLAEDNYVNQRILFKMLTKLGATVTLTSNGIELLEALSNDHYDLVLMDLMMPVMDGFEAVEKIRAEKKWSKLTIVPVTAAISEESHRRCAELGLKTILTKPFTIKQVQDILQQIS